jgi:hypothetical protein
MFLIGALSSFLLFLSAVAIVVNVHKQVWSLVISWGYLPSLLFELKCLLMFEQSVLYVEQDALTFSWAGRVVHWQRICTSIVLNPQLCTERWKQITVKATTSSELDAGIKQKTSTNYNIYNSNNKKNGVGRINVNQNFKEVIKKKIIN